jgi:DNA polymerase-1
MLYGLSPASLAYQLGKSEDETLWLMSEYYDNFPQVKMWMDEITTQTLVEKQLTLWTGRVWQAMPFDNMAYQGINAMIQGSSAELTNLSTIRLSSFLRSSNAGRILSIIHDEFLFSLNDTSVIPKLVEIMESEQLFGVKFLTDVEITETY